MSKGCIRVFADAEQIRQCKNDLKNIEVPISRLARVLNLSGNKVRLKILYLLQNETEMCPCDLSDILNMTVPAISQHLKKLKDGGLVVNKKVGQTIFYSIAPDTEEIMYLLDTLSKKERVVSNEE